MSHYHFHDWEYWSALGHRKPIKRRTGALNRVFRPPEPELGIALQWPGLYGRGASMGVIEDSRVKLPVGASRGYKYRAVWNERAIILSTSASSQKCELPPSWLSHSPSSLYQFLWQMLSYSEA